MNKAFENIYMENNKGSQKLDQISSTQELFEKVYSEAEMMNEMNPKLKALIAAGLIGTAGLGMQRLIVE